jgi:hypothetical protein
MGPAIRYAAVATKRLKSRIARTRHYYIPTPWFVGSVCAPEMNLARQGRWADDVIATREDGTAVQFGVLGSEPMCFFYGYMYRCAGRSYCYATPPAYDYPCVAHTIWGDLVTGGGAIRASNNRPLLPHMYGGGVIDTTGDHEGVASCEAAMAHIPIAADALAQGLLPGEPPSAARPIIDLGDLRVGRDDIHTLVATPGQDVTFYRANDVTLQSGRIYSDYGYTYQAEGAVLDFDSGVVLNVTGQFRMGRATSVWSYDGVINVVGQSGGVRLDKRATVQAAIIAAERTIRVRAIGGGYELPYGDTGQLLAEQVYVVGSGFINYQRVFDPDYYYYCP